MMYMKVAGSEQPNRAQPSPKGNKTLHTKWPTNSTYPAFTVEGSFREQSPRHGYHKRRRNALNALNDELMQRPPNFAMPTDHGKSKTRA